MFIYHVKFHSVLTQIQACSKVPRPNITQEQLARNSGLGRVLVRRFSFEEISKFVTRSFRAQISQTWRNKTCGVQAFLCLWVQDRLVLQLQIKQEWLSPVYSGRLEIHFTHPCTLMHYSELESISKSSPEDNPDSSPPIQSPVYVYTGHRTPVGN